MEANVVADRRSRPRRRLIEGRMMRCPRCKNLHDILQYVPMRLIEEFATETTVIYKCPECRWIFAPITDIVIDMLKKLHGLSDDEEMAVSQA